jgi:hypothetical protein
MPLFADADSAVVGLALPMTIRVSGRIAGLAVLAAEATGIATHADPPPKPGAGIVLVVVQAFLILWATDRRSAVLLKVAAPAAVTLTSVWTALAFAAPRIATGNAAALVAIVAAGFVVAASHRDAGRRLLRLVLIASAGTALLIFLMIGLILPSVPGFVSNSHPPTYTDVTRLVDPFGEFVIFVLLVAALGADVLRARVRSRRAVAREQRRGHVTGENEMVVFTDVDR